MTKKQPTRGESLAKAIISEYKPKTVEDMQNALKDVFGPMFEATPFSQKHPSHHLKDKIGHIPKNGQKHKMPWTCFQGRMGVKNTLEIHQKHPDELLEPR